MHTLLSPTVIHHHAITSCFSFPFPFKPVKRSHLILQFTTESPWQRHATYTPTALLKHTIEPTPTRTPSYTNIQTRVLNGPGNSNPTRPARVRWSRTYSPIADFLSITDFALRSRHVFFWLCFCCCKLTVDSISPRLCSVPVYHNTTEQVSVCAASKKAICAEAVYL